ncbi:MAG TPA: LuxR C-terminal-related transcriptional regulator [Tepidisphaeraceae bacterium]|jgi:DNA-binding NarL/FixJ family response regulator|nr:LuxR C-terminal-related transcriptional regulator [Tepidisphaeraceae bacterium]
MASRKQTRKTAGLGDVAIRVRARRAVTAASSPDAPGDPLDVKRRMLADFCRLIVASPEASTPPPATFAQPPDDIADLPPRLRQTLAGLLEGDSEKQVARHLNISPHTVHVYVKALYKRFNVASRGELLARWVKRSDTAPRGVTKRS